MLSLLAAAGEAPAPIYWVELGLTRGIDLGFFTIRWYSLAYLAGILLAYWHTLKSIKAPGAPLAQRHADDLFFYCTLGVIVPIPPERLQLCALINPVKFPSAS